MLGEWHSPPPPELPTVHQDAEVEGPFALLLKRLSEEYGHQQTELARVRLENAELRQRLKKQLQNEEHADVQLDMNRFCKEPRSPVLLRKALTLPEIDSLYKLRCASRVRTFEQIQVCNLSERPTCGLSLRRPSNEEIASICRSSTSEGVKGQTNPRPKNAWDSDSANSDLPITEPTGSTRLMAFASDGKRPSVIDFKVRPHWSSPDRKRFSSSLPGYQRACTTPMNADRKEDANFRRSRFVISPSCPQRVAWDVVGMFLLGYDIIMIPMEAFSPDTNIFFVMMDWITLIFWTGDMIASCITGYVSKGNTIMESKKIVKNYLRTWFLLDVIVVGPDWVFTILEMTNADLGGSGNLSKLLRALRAVRTARLLRLAKLKRVITMMKDLIESEVMFIVANVARLVVMLLFVNHFIGALWHLIGVVGKGSDLRNWLEVHGFDNEPLMYRYTTSLHWSLTQFTPGSMHVQPQNIMERTFSIMVLVFGLILFSSFISSITASLTQLRNMQGETPKQFWLLRRYFRQRGVPQELAFRILRYAEHACSSQKDLVPESRLWILHVLTEQLRNELQYHVCFSSLITHPLFEQASNMSQVTMHRLAATVLSRKSLAPSDNLITEDNAATHMHVVVSGDLQYVRMAADAGEVESIHPNDWLCEPALWTEWIHVGNAWAMTECSMISIGVVEFGQAVQKDPELWQMVSHYAKLFVQWLRDENQLDLTDIFEYRKLHDKVAGFVSESQGRQDS